MKHMYAHSYRDHRRKYRIARRGRFTACIIVFVVILILIAAAVFTTVSNASEEQMFKLITVQPGDTVWDIARTCGDPNETIRANIQSIYQLNEMDTPIIYPGQALIVPVSK